MAGPYFTRFNMLIRGIVLSIFLILHGIGHTQQIRLLTTGRPVSLRGLSAVNDQIIWVSGSAGSVGLSVDGGKTWRWTSVPNYEKTDFRDIEAFSEKEAVIMGITQPAVILRTVDGGINWKKSFEDSSGTMFLDAMDFNGSYGMVVGDPQDGKIFIAETMNGGITWTKKIHAEFETTARGESFFAASGSNCLIQKVNNKSYPYQYLLVSGGKKSNLYIGTSPDHSGTYHLSMNEGGETTGANSIAVNPSNPSEVFIVGGDFSHDSVRYGNSLRVSLPLFSQMVPLVPPHGYRSCVEYISDRRLICCGTNGVDISDDGGIHWRLISNSGFHVCRKARNGNSTYLAGAQGTVSSLQW